MLGNIGPSSQVQDGLADKYPLSAYALDYHVEAGVTDPEGVPPMIAQWASAQLWNATSLLVKCTIDLFTWAFSLDLLNGANGALAPIAHAITSLYENVIGEAWMVVAILAAGIWGIWKALVQRRYTETAGALGLSVVFVVLALFFVYQPERTVGQASQWTNTISLAFLSGANSGTLDDPRPPSARSPITSSTRSSTSPGSCSSSAACSTASTPTSATPTASPPRSRTTTPTATSAATTSPRTGPATAATPSSSSQPARPGSRGTPTARDDGAARQRTLPPRRDPPAARSLRLKVDKADAPAVDIQQQGGAFDRLTFSALIAVGALGAVALLGFLSLAVILAQIVALVLLGFAPVALVIGIFPGAGHAFFRGWLTKLATAIFIKALYSLVLAIVVAVSAALTASHRLARVPVRLRAADDLLLGDLPQPQADRQPPRRRHHRCRRRRGHPSRSAVHKGAEARPSPSPRSPASASPAAASRRASSP